MDRDEDVERLFSWLKTPDLRYREFASQREVAETVPTWPTVRSATAEPVEPSTVAPPPEPVSAPTAGVTPSALPPTRSDDRPPARSPGVPAGDRLMSALGRRVRAARTEQGRNGVMRETVAEELRAPARMAAAGTRNLSAPIAVSQRALEDQARAAAASRAAAEQARAAAERAAVEKARAAAEQAAAAEARAAAERAAAAEAHAAAEEARVAAEPLRRQQETIVMRPVVSRMPPRVEEPTVQSHPGQGHVQASPTSRVPGRGGGERPSLFGGSYRETRPSAAAPGRRGRPLAAVFSRISELEEQPAEPTEPPPIPPRPAGIFGRIR